MHAPPDAIDALRRLNPMARLGWDGKRFVLLQLFRPKWADEHEMKEPWNARGPVFGDAFDPLQYVPLMLEAFDAPVVFGGRFVLKVRRWMKSAKRRMREALEAENQAHDDKIKQLAGEMGAAMYRQAQTETWSGPITPYKSLTRADRDVLSGAKLERLRADAMRLPAELR